MLSIQSPYNGNTNHYEADEIQSSSSSSLSVENNESFTYNYYDHFPDPTVNALMNEQQNAHNDLTYHNSDWSTTKSPQPSFRDDMYSPVHQSHGSINSYSANYSTYDDSNSYTDVIHANSVAPVEPVYHHISWPLANEENMTSPTVSLPQKLDCSSPDFFLSNNRKQQQYGHHNLMSIFPTPPPPPPPQHLHQTMDNILYHQRSGHSLRPKGDKYHPRFKSANARLSPFTEQQDMFHQLMSSSSSTSPPSMNHRIMNKHSSDELMIDQETMNGSNNDDKLVVNQYYHDYQIKNEDILSNDQKCFQFDVVLHASTAVKKKHDEPSVTYLNRGQSYLIDLSATLQQQQQYPGGTMTSSISIAFHEPSHRQIAENYWKYWISQQENPKEARAIDLDINQTTGIYNICLVSFDRVSFDWHGKFGAKVYVRFNCLSTDFSRIKGVKGIPLRCVMETRSNYVSLPDDSMLYKGTFQRTDNQQQELYQYTEVAYCKIKLFRDKGAERKNKDDKKQMARQMEKVIASTNGNPQQHPLWPVISQTHKSTSVLSEVPSSPDVILEDFDDTSLINIMIPTSAPTSISSGLQTSPTSKRRRTNEKPNTKAIADLENSCIKKSRTALCFYVWTRHVNSTPQEVHLEQLTTHDLKTKLGDILSIHPSRISDILWKRKKSDVLVLVEDSFITEHIVDGEMMTVNLEIKADGNLRLVLEF